MVLKVLCQIKNTKMKTTMQELIETLEEMVAHGGDMDLLPAIEHAKKLLKKEKYQIVSAYNQGYRDGENAEESTKSLADVSEWADAELYYKQTFSLKAVSKGSS